MVALNENSGRGDPRLAELCVRAYHGDNDAMDELEAEALKGNGDALNLMKLANAPSAPAQAADFAVQYRDMLLELFRKFGEGNLDLE